VQILVAFLCQASNLQCLLAFLLGSLSCVGASLSGVGNLPVESLWHPSLLHLHVCLQVLFTALKAAIPGSGGDNFGVVSESHDFVA
jgi:hypothetical protein